MIVQLKITQYNETFEIANLKIFPLNYEVYIEENKIELTPKEFELLLFLTKNKGRVLTRDYLLSEVWGYEYTGEARIVDVHISHLREKIEQDSKRPEYIKSIRGVGYKIEESN